MDIKSLFDSNNQQSENHNLEVINKSLRSEEYIENVSVEKNRYMPAVDYTTASNFAKYGSAEKYYTDSISSIYKTYPYDGSSREKQEWRNDASDLDLYFYDNLYPKFKGYIELSGGQSVRFNGDIKLDATATNIKDLKKTNVYDPSLNRSSNIVFPSGSTAVTVEFLYKRDEVSNYNHILANFKSDNREIAVYSSNTQLGVFLNLTSEGFVIPETVDVYSWNHYAFVISTSSIKLFINGVFIEQKILSNASNDASLGSVTGSIGANIGSFPHFFQTSGSFDEFRFWKTERTEEQIYQYHKFNIDGGSNTDNYASDLSVYYKFNEGISGVASNDAIVLDYSGRIANGVVLNYTPDVRKQGSAIDLLPNNDGSEIGDVILNSAHQDVVALYEEYQLKGRVHDEGNINSSINMFPSWILDEEQQSDKQELNNLVQIMSSYLDNLNIQIDSLTKIGNISYTQELEKPLPDFSKILSSYGFSISDIFSDTTILEEMLSRNDDINYAERLETIKNSIYKNIYNNLSFIYKSKGTEKSFRNLIRCFGIDDEVIKLNILANNFKYKLENKSTTSTALNKYINFNSTDNFGGTIFLSKSSSDADFRGYIDGIDDSLVPFTLEAEFVLPKKFDVSSPLYFDTPFLSSSIFGMHPASTDESDTSWYGNNCDLMAYAVKKDTFSKDISFQLVVESIGFTLSSPTIPEAYENKKWNLAIRIKDKKFDKSGRIFNDANVPYTLEFYGVSTYAGYIDDSFSVSADITAEQASNMISARKRIYGGAHYDNFTGSLLQQTDVKLSNIKFWYDYLNDEEITAHSLDPLSYGVENPQNIAYFQSTSSYSSAVSRIETLALHWNFANVSSSDDNGQFSVLDNSSGDVDLSTRSSIFNSINKKHTGLGRNFIANSKSIVDSDYIFRNKKTLPEYINSDELIQVLEEDTISLKKSPKPTVYYYKFEKNMYQTISEEMLNMFSDVSKFANVFAKPIDALKYSYDDLEHIRGLFFDKVNNKPDIEKFIEFYKWIDSSITDSLQQLVPATARVSKTLSNTVESHIFERNKINNRGWLVKTNDRYKNIIARPTKRDNWVDEKAPTSPAGGNWYKKRAIRTDAVDGVNTPGRPDIDAQRELIRKAMYVKPLSDGKYVYDSVGNEIPSYKYSTGDASVPVLSLTSSLNDIISDSITPANIYPKIKNYSLAYQNIVINGSAANNRIGLNVGNSVAKLLTFPLNSDITGSAAPIKKTYKTIFISRFSAPGERKTQTLAFLDPAGSEYSAYTNVNARNLDVRTPYNKLLSNTSSIDTVAPSIHKVNKNPSYASSKITYDNWFVQHQIPRSDKQYAWIKNSIITATTGTGYMFPNSPNIDATSEIAFSTGTIGANGYIDYVGTNLVIQTSVDTSSNTIGPASSLTGTLLNNYLLNMNGPYGAPSWKQSRVANNPLMILDRKNNIITVQDGDAQTTSAFRESPVQYNFETQVLLYDSKNKKMYPYVLEVENSRDTFANKDLLSKLNLADYDYVYDLEKTAPTYKKIKDMVFLIPEQYKLIRSMHKQVLFPNKSLLGLKESRNKPNYTEASGTGSNGYDRNVATIRSFWRDTATNRLRTIGAVSGAVNSLNYFFVTPQGNNNISVANKSLCSNITLLSDSVSITSSYSKDRKYNSFWAQDTNIEASTSSLPTSYGSNVSMSVNYSSVTFGELGSYPEYYILNNILSQSGYVTTGSINTNFGLITNYYFNYNNTTGSIASGIQVSDRYIPKPQFLFINHKSSLQYNTSSNDVFLFTLNNGTKYLTDVLSNNKPWFDSYDDFSSDFRTIGKNYSIIPEYKISNNMEYYIKEKNGYFSTAPKNYLDIDGASAYSNTSNIFNKFVLDSGESKKVKIKVNAIKKLLPYKGFYPSERSTQIVELFQDSFFGLTPEQMTFGANTMSPSGSASSSYLQNKLTPFDQQVSTIIQPLFAPGILYNTIKAGMAVDWPVMLRTDVDYDSAAAPSFYETVKGGALAGEYMYQMTGTFDHRIQFEDILNIETIIPQNFKNKNLYYLNPTYYNGDIGGYTSGSLNTLYNSGLKYPSYQVNYKYNNINPSWTSKNALYSLGIHNYLAEIPTFFLKNESLNNFTSKPGKSIKSVIAGKVYSMDVYIKKDSNYSNFVEFTGSGIYSASSVEPFYPHNYFSEEFFGPPSKWLEDNTLATPEVQNGNFLTKFSYQPYAPPYYYGKSIARLSYSSSFDGSTTIKDILENLKIEFINTEKDNELSAIKVGKIGGGITYYYDTAAAYTNSMNLGACINFKQLSTIKDITYDASGNPITVGDSTQDSQDVWSIQTKFEVPVLNFNNDLNINAANSLIKTQSLNSGKQFSSIFQTVGLWSGYGSAPESGKGIAFGIEDSVPKLRFDPISKTWVINVLTGSLIDLCGFQTSQKDIGAVADSKEISEAVILIPYVEKGYENLDNNSNAKNILGIIGENGVSSDTRDLGPFYFSIDKQKIKELTGTDFQLLSKDVVKKALNIGNKDNSILKTMDLMTSYNIPPHLDWLNNKNIDPFVMYVCEFKHTLDKQDLTDIWQGLMPKIAQSAQLDDSSFEHKLDESEFFHGKNLPNNIKFKIFKVKKKAKTNYYSLTADSSDDNRFKFKFNNQEKQVDYSYNWPYDYFSLIEMVNVEATTESGIKIPGFGG